jgi:DNA invertase Pin-like site-specific DNA recombinase
MTKTPVRAAVYLRQSKDPNDDRLAISRQRDDCLALCAAKGWTPIEPHYVDNDRSASNGKLREHYQRMLDDIRAGRVDAVVVWDLDRLHRRPVELEAFIDLADAKHLALASVGGDFDLSTPTGRGNARMKGVFARMEMEQKSLRQKRAAEQRAEMGEQWWSIRPFGYDRAPILDDAGEPVVNKHGKPMWKPVCEPVEAAAIRAAYSAVLGGVSLYRITETWNAAGLTTPRGNRWRGTQVRQVLLSPRNCGLRSFRGELQTHTDKDRKGERIKGNWEPIVAEEVWQDVSDKLGDPGRRCGRSRARKYLLSGIARCGACGAGLGSGVTKRPRQNPVYTCKACNRVSRNAAFVDELAREAVIRRLSRPDAIELIAPDDRDDLDEIRERARALRARLDAIAVEFADGILSASQIKTATKRINEQLAEADAAILGSQATHVFDGLLNVDDVAAAFHGLSLDRQRAVVDALLAIVVRPSGRCGRTLRREDVDVVFHQQAA